MKTRLLILYKQAILQNPGLEAVLLDMLKGEGKLIAQRAWKPVPMQRVHALYKEHEGKKNSAGKEYFPLLIAQFKDLDSITYVLESDEGDEWVKHLRDDVIGATDPSQSKKGTFREAVHQINHDSIAKATAEQRTVDNGVHCSDSVESGKRESRIFYQDHPLNPHAIINPGECAVSGSLARELMRTGDGVFLDELIEDSLKTKRIIPEASELVSYEELMVTARGGQKSYGWAPRGAESYTAAGSAKFRQGGQEAEKRFIAKACTKFCPEQAVHEWMQRREVLRQEGVMVPELLYQGPAEYYEQFLPLTAEAALSTAAEPQLSALIEDIGRIERVLKERFKYAVFDLKELRSDGRRIYVCDYGEDIGALRR